MLKSIIHFSINNKLIIGLLVIGLIAWGSYSITQLPIDAVPDITNNQVQVLTVAPSQSALDIERLVTFPVEQTMATIPGIEEIRSFSRFGLSVVTIVFEESVDNYWARQQVNERLTEAARQIPAGVGTPEMAPVTTGLGEIYQYYLGVKPGYEDQYSIMELRSIQDWIVRRQLLGTAGVADVSSFGGYLKQYEIALNPERLRSLNLSVHEVLQALEDNNQNTGGAYIEKNSSAYFIRSEGLAGSVDDLNNVVVRSNASGFPMLIRDIATVKLGNAIRYGAMTQNGKSETVGAVVMMLKGANSSKVIANVKERIAQIEATLPEGVTIKPFLDRTKLVNQAITTVSKNLAEGALIVVFVLVLLLGNLRAGLVVASVIPLSMLFAVSMMNLFGVSGNLMSLGAIDFGLIVDGAVIIVEATLHHITTSGFTNRLSTAEMNNEVEYSANKMMRAAAFGQIIILMVYIPILSLVGIEGKMFRPMAQTVMFAISGALILSLTYVPMASSLFLSRKPIEGKNISDRIIDFTRRFYEPALRWSLRNKVAIIAASLLLFAGSLFVFNNLGGEFLPELDEGDFAVDTRIITGGSLSATVDATLRAEAVLLKNFPEVEMVIGKIGSGEIPTDPMPIEAADLMVIMKEKSVWVSARTKDEIIEKMQNVLHENVPGVWFGFQHPIQMRFNELMTGARQDVVVKVYGEDLDKLTAYAEQIGRIVPGISGAESLFIENITGLPQIVVRIRREQLARYGLTVSRVNDVINAAMAGQPAGLLFEGERRFDIVVRLDIANRQSIEDVRSLYITTDSGQQIPLQQVADVTMEVGPNQIQRDDAKRRIVIGFNTRGRDVESIVEELSSKINNNVNFEPGYYVTFGGTFKNLQEARARLMIAVPLALVLIFVLLYFTFGSVKQVLLIYTAIPLSAIGGVMALWIRDMPFSISAGVGFIALFGVAVLNGIVLISEFNKLKKDGQTNIIEIIMSGTATRLRPVLMTALVASLGFLPMALSHGSGAEVQKPLASVVIGGLVSATLLTLIVLPVLYAVVESLSTRPPRRAAILLSTLLIIATTQGTFAQDRSLPEAIGMAVNNHPGIQYHEIETQRVTALGKTAIDVPKTNVSLLVGQYNSIQRDDNSLTISQSIPFPTVWSRARAYHDEVIRSATLREKVMINEVTLQVKEAFNQLLYYQAREKVLLGHDSLLSRMARAADIQHKTGEGTLLSKTMAETQHAELRNRLNRNEADIESALLQLRLLCQSDSITGAIGELESAFPAPPTDSLGFTANPSLSLGEQELRVAEREKKLAGAHAMPDLTVGFFSQTLIGTQTVDGQEQYFGSNKRFTGFQFGVSLPLWIVPHAGRIKAAEFSIRAAEQLRDETRLRLEQQFQKAVTEVYKNKRSLDYYTGSALQTSSLLTTQTQRSYEAGELDYPTLIINMQLALNIREGYLNALLEHNQSIIKLEYLEGNPGNPIP
jgi:cobalt-zinc-cadmium resistance protein CzcA